MSDIPMPEEIIKWMKNLNWGPHHNQWHFERRWDFYHYLAEHGNPQQQAGAKPMVEYAHQQGWQRSQIQEGQPGNGIDFLMMHRAMLHLIVEEFPEHQQLVVGWKSPPTVTNDPDDPVPSGAEFNPVKLEGVKVIETGFESFADDDSYGLFIETDILATPENPTNRDPDQRKGLHNYLHNRWADGASSINLGNPEVNHHNQRFWKLHGWIDTQWTRFRQAKGFSDNDPQYQAALAQYKHMMGGHMHPMFADLEEGTAVELPEGFNHFFQF